METIVIRGDGSKEGPAIVDRLLTTNQARQERGRIEIDTNCSSRVIRDMNTLKPDWLTPGTFVEISDVEQGRVAGNLMGISFSLNADGSVARVLRVEVEAG